MKQRLESALTALLVAGALVVAALVAWRELAPRGPGPFVQGSRVAGWETAAREVFGAEAGRRPVQVAIFADYTCRYCRSFEGALDSLEASFGDRVAISRQHYPQDGEGIAFTAALASECAGRQLRGPAFHRILYARQEALPAAPLDSLARWGGIPDVPAFHRCVAQRETAPAVLGSRERGQALGIRGTPTTIVNGRAYLGALPYRELSRLVRRELDARRPAP